MALSVSLSYLLVWPLFVKDIRAGVRTSTKRGRRCYMCLASESHSHTILAMRRGGVSESGVYVSFTMGSRYKHSKHVADVQHRGSQRCWKARVVKVRLRRRQALILPLKAASFLPSSSSIIGFHFFLGQINPTNRLPVIEQSSVKACG